MLPSVMLSIAQEATQIGCYAAIFWPPKVAAAQYGLGDSRGMPALIRAERTYFPMNFGHPAQHVFIQMSLNAVTHRAAEDFYSDDNVLSLLWVSGCAAMGAMPGTFAMTQHALGEKQSMRSLLYRLSTTLYANPSARGLFAAGILFEVLREALYNSLCLNGLRYIETSHPHLPIEQKVAATGALSMLGGALSGLPNALASYAYSKVFSAREGVKVNPTQLLLSAAHRSLGIGAVFTVMAVTKSLSPEEDTTVSPNAEPSMTLKP